MKPIAVYLHIPKAGGSSVARLMNSIYGEDRVFRMKSLPQSRLVREGENVLRDVERYYALPEPERRKIAAFRGPIDTNLASHLPQDTVWFTFVREPSQRILSRYLHILRDPRLSLHKQVTSSRMSLADFVASDLSHEVVNGQSWRLAGFDLDAFVHRTTDNPPEILERALKAMQTHLAVTGLTERFDESLLLLRPVLDWPAPYYSARNTNPTAPPAIPEEALKVIRERNALDYSLYSAASHRLEEAIRSRGPGFKQELARFRWRNRIYQLKSKLFSRWPFRVIS